jgi:hypothetical protein
MTALCAPEDLPVAVIAQAWRDAGLCFARSDEKNHLAKRHPISREDRAHARMSDEPQPIPDPQYPGPWRPEASAATGRGIA